MNSRILGTNAGLAMLVAMVQVASADVGARETVTDSWFGLGPSMDERGVSVGASFLADESSVLTGGIEGSSAYRHRFDLGIDVALESLVGWKGGSLFVDFQAHKGQDGSEYVGDIQAFSNLDADETTAAPEAWFQQEMGPMRAKLGKVDANSEFGYVEVAGVFLNSSASISPTVFLIPTYPDPALSANLFYDAGTGPYVGAGLYDGAALEGVPTGQLWGKSAFEGPDHAFLISEAGWKRASDDGASRLALGVWHHNGAIPTFAGDALDGTEGFYALAERSQSTDHGTVGVYLQFGTADGAVSEVDRHLGAGVTWTGAFATRPDDTVGFGVSQAGVTNDPDAGFAESSETVFELVYRAQLLPYLAVAPDVQYVTNPGASTIDDAAVGTVRIEVTF